MVQLTVKVILPTACYPGVRVETEAAKAELAAFHTKDVHPMRDCQAEADALGHHLQPRP